MVKPCGGSFQRRSDSNAALRMDEALLTPRLCLSLNHFRRLACVVSGQVFAMAIHWSNVLPVSDSRPWRIYLNQLAWVGVKVLVGIVHTSWCCRGG